MKLPTNKLISASITAFSFLALLALNCCKDIVFNNPLDPDASVETVKIIKVTSTTLSGKGDICCDGEKFWKTSQYGSLDAFDMESGIIIRSVPAEGGSGVTIFEDSLYLCGGENIIYSLDPLSGEILNRISTADLYPGFLTAGDNPGLLIAYDLRSSGFFEYDPQSGAAALLFQVPGLDIGGIEIYKGGLLVTDLNSESIYYFAKTGSIINVFRSPAGAAAGITVDHRDYVYLLTLDGKLYTITLP
ncbi:MAG: hypothetical protein KAW12_02475 [Candidatus Aminicenantes bacterium]|nr:hypothetical protein [Candidatus Aminicenantes bacterium]